MYVSIDEQHMKDFEDFYYVDSLKLVDDQKSDEILKTISKSDLKTHNCQRFKLNKIETITDDIILNRKSYRKNYYEYNTIQDFLNS